MRRRWRVRRVAKWTLTVICAAHALAFVTSYLRPTGVDLTGWRCRRITVASGAVSFYWCVPRQPEPPVGGIPAFPLLFVTGRFDPFSWRPLVERFWWGGRVTVPLWTGCALFGIAAAAVWRRDRRWPPPGHCRRCGYDLTGNVSGRCPECAETI